MYTIDASVWVNSFDPREPGHVSSRQLLEVLRAHALPSRDNQLIAPEPEVGVPTDQVRRRERLGGLLSCYYREVA